MDVFNNQLAGFYLMKKSAKVIHQPSLKFPVNIKIYGTRIFGDWFVKKEVGL
jgi:hypothetical protein